MANQATNNLSVIDGATNDVVGAIPVGANPFAMAYDPANERVYAINEVSNNTSVVDTARDEVVSASPSGRVRMGPRSTLRRGRSTSPTRTPTT